MTIKKRKEKASDFALVTKLYPKSHDCKGDGQWDGLGDWDQCINTTMYKIGS